MGYKKKFFFNQNPPHILKILRRIGWKKNFLKKSKNKKVEVGAWVSTLEFTYIGSMCCSSQNAMERKVQIDGWTMSGKVIEGSLRRGSLIWESFSDRLWALAFRFYRGEFWFGGYMVLGTGENFCERCWCLGVKQSDIGL